MSSNSSILSVFVWIVVIIIGLYWLGNKIYYHFRDGEQNPFWTGTELVQVCKKPYYSSEGCYTLEATLLDVKTVKIHFNNGGYVVSEGLACYYHASEPNVPEYVFCRSWDREGNQWDFLPRWVKY